MLVSTVQQLESVINIYTYKIKQINIQKKTNKKILKRSLLLLMLSHFSHVWLCATPQMAAHQASPSLGFSRQEHWSGLPFPSPMHEREKWKWSCSVVSKVYLYVNTHVYSRFIGGQACRSKTRCWNSTSWWLASRSSMKSSQRFSSSSTSDMSTWKGNAHLKPMAKAPGLLSRKTQIGLLD